MSVYLMVGSKGISHFEAVRRFDDETQRNVRGFQFRLWTVYVEVLW